MSRKFVLIAVAAFAVTLAACGGPAPDPTPIPTNTLLPTNTPAPTATHTPEPTATSEPTATPIPPTETPLPEPTDEPVAADDSEFVTYASADDLISISAPSDWYMESDAGYIGLGTTEEVFNADEIVEGVNIVATGGEISLMEMAYELDGPTAEDLLNRFLGDVVGTEGEIVVGPEDLSVDGVTILNTVVRIIENGQIAFGRILVMQNETNMGIVLGAVPEASADTYGDTVDAIFETFMIAGNPQNEEETAVTEDDATRIAPDSDAFQWQYITDEDNGYAFLIPTEWVPFEVDPNNIQAGLDLVAENNETAADFFNSDMVQNLALTGVKYMAIDGNPDNVLDTIPANVNIIAIDMPAGGLGMEMMVNLTVQQVETILPVETEINTDVLDLSGNDVGYFNYTMAVPDGLGNTPMRAIEQYMWMVDGTMYTVSFNSPVDLADYYSQIGRMFAEGFEILP